MRVEALGPGHVVEPNGQFRPKRSGARASSVGLGVGAGSSLPYTQPIGPLKSKPILNGRALSNPSAGLGAHH